MVIWKYNFLTIQSSLRGSIKHVECWPIQSGHDLVTFCLGSCGWRETYKLSYAKTTLWDICSSSISLYCESIHFTTTNEETIKKATFDICKSLYANILSLLICTFLNIQDNIHVTYSKLGYTNGVLIIMQKYVTMLIWVAIEANVHWGVVPYASTWSLNGV